MCVCTLAQSRSTFFSHLVLTNYHEILYQGVSLQKGFVGRGRTAVTREFSIMNTSGPAIEITIGRLSVKDFCQAFEAVRNSGVKRQNETVRKGKTERHETASGQKL